MEQYSECKWCNAPLERKPLETSSNFKKRKYCNQSCNAQHREAKRRDK